ncbi:isochorismatase family protein [Actinomadura craniellae]|uniref:isochorismatase family protein n=1 Tax=Actinomadura craniellae TaxID=2231787 RepID=UPI0013140DBA|nr:isochorismatase family protein [Actinomadura craniellae]
MIAIDLQVRIVGMETKPYGGADVVRQSMRLADAFREHQAQVVIVQHDWGGERPPAASELVDEMLPRGTDLLVAKKSQDAFERTGLHGDLRERGVTALVLAGIATDGAVEITARTAAGTYGYELFLVEDAMTAFDPVAHDLTVGKSFPALGTVCTTDEVVEAL